MQMVNDTEKAAQARLTSPMEPLVAESIVENVTPKLSVRAVFFQKITYTYSCRRRQQQRRPLAFPFAL
jgi:hypothetical protein